MTRISFRPTLLVLLAIWLAVVTFAASLLAGAQLARWENRFDDEARHLVSVVRNKLDTNEAVLAGFAAFLQAVERSDSASAERFAASVTRAYPHIYMLEVARKVARNEEAAVADSLRQHWRPGFRIRDFAEVTGRPAEARPHGEHSWLILFMYPSLPQAEPIYGLRLETVGHLAGALNRAQASPLPVASPVFNLLEGGSAYILLQQVVAPYRPLGGEIHLFGSDMAALLVIRADALMPSPDALFERSIRFTAHLVTPEGPASLLFAHEPAAQSGWNPLPRLVRQLHIDSPSQPLQMHFERQLQWREMLTGELSLTMGLLLGALIIVPILIVRHYRSLDSAAIENERSAYLATHDLLTDLPNRFLFADRFARMLQHWQRNGMPFALLLIDLDHFKDINDRHGHAVGDRMLVVTAQRLSAALRAGDTLARQGGDEFIALLANIDSAEMAAAVGDKLRMALADQVIETASGSLRLSCSIGVAICPTDGTDLDNLFRQADLAMYEAKKRGRNQVSTTQDESNSPQGLK